MAGFTAPESDLAPASGGMTAFGDPILGATPAVGRKAQDIGDAILSGLQNSATGLALRGKMPSQVLGEDAPWYQRLAANAAGVVADIPLSIAAAIPAAPSGPIGMGAAGFAAPMALREGLIEAYSGNHALSWAGVWDIAKAAMVGGTKGAVIGAATMGAGRFAGAALGPTATTGARTLASTGAELATLTTTSAALEGHMPTAQDFMDNAILLGGMKGAMKVASGLRNIYVETGKTPAEVLNDAAKNPAIKLDLKPVEARATNEPMVEVHHGSPHTFDKFDASKIGTGEGAQAYGYGLYFADSAMVAEGYKRQNSLLNAAEVRAQTDAVAALRSGQTDGLRAMVSDAIQAARDDFAHFEKRIASNAELAKYIEEGIEPGKGALYKVQIPQRIVGNMLDWDKPLSEQSPAVQALVQKTAELRKQQTGNIWEPLKPDTKGAELIKTLGEGRMKESGITGIRYLDGDSRAAGKGSSNYVLFDAEHARVVERNGQAIGQTQAPTAYAPLALNERIKAALDTDPRPGAMLDALFPKADAVKPMTEGPIKEPVRLEYVVSNESHKGVIRELAVRYETEVKAQTRGVVPNTQTLAEARELAGGGRLGPHEVGAAANAGETAARTMLLKAATQDAFNAWAEVNRLRSEKLEIPVEAKLQALAATERVAAFYAEARGVIAEWGRAGQILGQIKRDPSILGDAKALLELNERKGTFQDMAAMVGRLKDPSQMTKFADAYTKATTMEMFIEGQKAFWLSGPQTHLANLMGNAAKWIVDVPESALSASLYALDRAAKGDPLTMAQFKARAFAPILGLQMGARDALTVAAEALRGHGEHLEKVDIYRTAIPGKTGEGVRLPFRFLQAEDAIMRVPAERAQAYIMAVDRAAKEGLHPDTAEFRAAATKYMQEPTIGLTDKAAVEAMAKIEQAGAEAVFSQRLGPRMEMLQRSMAGHWSSLIIPFVRTPANLVSWAVQHVPGLNFVSARWRADFAAGGEAQAKAVARVVIGTGIATIAYSLAEDGMLTGGGMFDKEQRGTKSAAGWQPYSIKIGDTYYSYQRLEPVAKVLGISADLIELSNKTTDEEDKAKIAAMLVLMFGNATVSTTYLSGLSNTINAVTDPERYGGNLIEQYASGLVPKIIGQPTAMADPYKREVDGALEAIQSQIPFLREKLLPKRDVWGEPVKNARLFEVMPVATSQISQDKVRTEAMRLAVAISDAPKFLVERGPFSPKEERIKLTGEQRDIFKEVSGKNAMSILAPIVNAPDWERIPDFAKAAVYKNVIEGARKQGQYAALPADDTARQQLRQKIVDKIIQQTNAAQGDTRTKYDGKGERQ